MKNFLTNNLTHRFLLLMGGLVLFTAFSSQAFYARQERTNLETRLREKANFINNFYAFLIADALVRKDDVTLQQVANRLEEDQEIFSVVVTDAKGYVRYNRDAEKVGLPTEDPAIATALKTGEAVISTYQNSGGKALALLTPLKVAGLNGPLGAIRIDLTHNTIEKQVKSSRRRFWFIVLGSMVTCAGFVSFFVQRWVLAPIETMKGSLAVMNPASPEGSLKHFTDEMGEVANALNRLLDKIRAEMQHQSVALSGRGEKERDWIFQLAATFIPGARILIADKDNRLLADTEAAPTKGKRAHLLDLISDSAFAALLTSAFEKEGVAARGDVSFQGKPYLALILSVPSAQSVAVKTIIALQPK